MEDLRQQVGSNMMDGGLEELRQGVGNMIVGGVVPNHANNVHRRSKTRVTMHALMSEALPLDEAARLEMKALPNKTPVSVLQELLSRRGTTPKYELVQIEGAIHEPTFRYRVTVADVVAMGTGRSKKEAKHAAAKTVLDKLIGVNTENPVEAPIPNSIPDSQNIQEIQSGYGEEKVVNNPIGSLQEMCMSRHWPPPKYSMEGEEGLPHERQFTIVCSILKYRQVGQGKSKKLAKRQAAHKMWQSLQDTNSNRSQGVDEDEIVQRNANVNAHYADLKDSKIATLTTPHSHKVSQFHKNLKSSTGVKLFELQNTCLNDGDVNLVQFLQEIASEQQFEVTYVDVEEKSITGKCQCLVQLSTLPVAVCYGSGMTSKDAQAAAAQNALEYLKIMTKKSNSKLYGSDDQMPNLKISKIDHKLETESNNGNRITKTPARTTNTEFKTLANCKVISSGKHGGKKISNSTGENNKIIDRVKSSVGRFDSVRSTNCSINTPSDIQLTTSKDYCANKYVNELGSKFKNYQSECHKDISVNQQDSKARSIDNFTPRYSNHVTSSGFHRENHQVTITQYSRDDNSSNYVNSTIYAVGRKNLDQQSIQAKITPVNFPPLRAPQSIVNVRHPFLTEARTKHNEIIPSNGLKSKSTLNTIPQSSAKDLEPGRQTYHNFGTSTLNMTTNMSPYPRPDPFPQPTLASILFPDTGQFSQSASSYSTNQLNQFQTYDPASYHTSTPVMPQFSENSLSFPQYDSTTFVQPSHYPTADLSSNQFQYQTPGVGQIQDSTMFIQGLQNPITMTDQYATPNYTRAVRTELIHRLRRPPRFTK